MRVATPCGLRAMLVSVGSSSRVRCACGPRVPPSEARVRLMSSWTGKGCPHVGPTRAGSRRGGASGFRAVGSSPAWRLCPRLGWSSAGPRGRRRGVSSPASVGGGKGAEEAGVDFYVTTPLFYVNAAPHMGSVYPTVAADAACRFHKLLGERAEMTTGSDEHGEKIALAAEKAGMSPQEFVDGNAEKFKALWGKMDVGYNHFVRTTDTSHEAIVLEMLERVWEKGDIYLDSYSGLYCVACEEFKDELELAADESGKQCLCPIHRAKVAERSEENYFFKLSNYQTELEELVQRPGFVRPESARQEVLRWIEGGARDFSISRAAVDWGIRIPRDPKQTVYVWFDALTGYLSSLGLDEGLGQAQAKGWPASVQIIGKDILRFHAVYWPAMLMSAGLPPPGAVFGHGFLTKDGMKMGKSLGNVLVPEELVEQWGVDAVRYYFLSEIEFGVDGDYAEERFVNSVNADLANNLGNLTQRCLKQLVKHHGEGGDGGAVLPCTPLPGNVQAVALKSLDEAREAYGRLDFREACRAASRLGNACNAFVDTKAPWALFKSESAEDRAEAAAVCVTALEAVRVAAIILGPVVPRLSLRLLNQLGVARFDEHDLDEGWRSVRWEHGVWGSAEGLREGLVTNAPLEGGIFSRLQVPKQQGTGQQQGKQKNKKQKKAEGKDRVD